MKDQIIEEELLREAKSGSISAFEKILFAYEKPVYGYIYRMTGQREDAEDLTQETFIKIYKHLKDIDAGKNFQAWIYKIATNIVYDWFRSKKVRPETRPWEEFSNNETSETSSPYLDIERVNQRGDIERAMEKIRPVYKAVLALFYEKDISYTEIAEALAIPENTVKTYLHRAKKALKDELQNVQSKNGEPPEKTERNPRN